MRFLHLGDLHIGKSIGEFDLIEDQKFMFHTAFFLQKVVNWCIINKCQL